MKLQTLLKNKYEKDESDFEDKINKVDKKIRDVSSFIKKQISILKLVKQKVLTSISDLATSSALTAVENKIPDVSDLVKKTDYDTKINDIENKITGHDYDKYITTPEFNTMAASAFNVRLASQTDLI